MTYNGIKEHEIIEKELLIVRNELVEKFEKRTAELKKAKDTADFANNAKIFLLQI